MSCYNTQALRQHELREMQREQRAEMLAAQQADAAAQFAFEHAQNLKLIDIFDALENAGDKTVAPLIQALRQKDASEAGHQLAALVSAWIEFLAQARAQVEITDLGE
jgi:hypothetical protein